MRGRNRKPTKLKILQGNPGHRPLNDQEPEPEPGIPDMPAWIKLYPIAISEWKRESKILNDVGIMTIADAGILATRCYVASEIQLITKQIKKRGRVLKTKDGFKTNPLIVQLKNYITEYRQYGSLLGLDAASRSKLKTGKPKEKSAADQFRDRKNAAKKAK